MKALTVKMETVTLIGKGRQNLTCFVYLVYAINSKMFFLRIRSTFGGLSWIYINKFSLGRHVFIWGVILDRVILYSGKYGIS